MNMAKNICPVNFFRNFEAPRASFFHRQPDLLIILFVLRTETRRIPVRLVATFLGAGFLDTARFRAGFLDAAFFGAGFLRAGFFRAVFLGAAFLRAGFLGAAFFRAGFLGGGFLADFGLSALS